MNILQNPSSPSVTSPSGWDAVILAALSRMDGVGGRVLFQLLQEAGSVQALWEASDAFLSAHLTPAKARAFRQKRDKGLDGGWLETYEKLGILVIAYTDSRYPPLLKEIHAPPLILYIKGNPDALTGKTIAAVGTRRASEYGRQVTEKLIADLKPANVSIISGLAAGIDTCAHWAALKNHLPTAAVFGCGLDIIFPVPNRRLSEEILDNGGALVSEYPLGIQGSKFTYPQRNRVVSGLSHGVLVVEGNIRSGSLITARMAVEEGRSVYTVPGNIFSPGSEGPMHLLKSGAVPVSCGDDILKDLNWWLEPQPRQVDSAEEQILLQVDGLVKKRPSAQAEMGLSKDESRLLKVIPYDPVSVETVQRDSGLPFAQMNELLTLLELEDLIVLLPGAKVCRK